MVRSLLFQSACGLGQATSKAKVVGTLERRYISAVHTTKLESINGPIVIRRIGQFFTIAITIQSQLTDAILSIKHQHWPHIK